MTSSPNEDLSPLQRGLRLARAIVATSAADADDGLGRHEQDLLAATASGAVVDAWTEVISDRGRWYYMTSSSGAGRSRAALPEGEAPARSYDVRGCHPATDQIRTIIEELGDELATPPGQVIAGSLAAAEPHFNGEIIQGFRGSLEATASADMPRGVPSVDQLAAFSKDLASRRAQYAADSPLFGSVATMVEIVVRARAPDRYVALTRYLADDPETDPVRLLDGVVREAAHRDMVGELMHVADGLADRAEQEIDSAKRASDLNTALNHHYWAIPRAFGALKIYRTVGELAQPPLQDVAKKRARHADETYTRCGGALRCQLTDLDGVRWRAHQAILRGLLLDEGPTAAAEYATREFVERHLFYPRSLLPDLLAGIIGDST